MHAKLGAALLLLAITPSPPGAAAAGPTPPDFYTPPASLVGPSPGQVLKDEPFTLKAEPTGLIGIPVTARRIMYVSTTSAGAPVAVTGTVITPKARWTGT